MSNVEDMLPGTAALPRTALRGFRLSALAPIYGPTLIILALTWGAKLFAGIPPSFFSRDPMATLDGHPLTGMQSTLGVLVWCAAAAICFFTGRVLRQRRLIDGEWPSFLLWSGAISSLLALDDLFLVHEDLAYRYLSLDDKVIFLAYGFLVGWYVIRFRRKILSTEYLLLFFAFAFFGLSLGVDFFQSRWSSPWRIFFEDGFKLVGIATWSGYFITTSFQALVGPVMKSDQRPPTHQTIGQSAG